MEHRSNIGLWIVLGLLLGAGVAWSLGLFEPGGEQPAALDDPPALIAPRAPPPVDAPPAEAPPVEAAPLEAPPVEAAPLEAPPVEAEPLEAPPIEAPPKEAPPPETPTPEPPPAPPSATPPAEVVPPAEVSPPSEAPTEAAAPVALQTGLVRVAGDAAEVRLVRGGRRYSGGRMPPGSYLVEAVFQAGEAPRVAGKLNLEVGDKKLVHCAAAFYRCQVY
jgi:outer membrane biosynthesis protein TonB